MNFLIYKGDYQCPAIMLTVINTVLISFINYSVEMLNYWDGHRILFILGAAAGICSVIQIGPIIQKMRMSILNYYGRNSLILLETHYLIIDIVKNVFNIDEFSVVSEYIFLVTLPVIEVLVIYIISIFSLFMVGKFYKNS